MRVAGSLIFNMETDTMLTALGVAWMLLLPQSSWSAGGCATCGHHAHSEYVPPHSLFPPHGTIKKNSNIVIFQNCVCTPGVASAGRGGPVRARNAWR